MTSNCFHVSLALFRECDLSIIYGVDTLWASGRLWNTAKGLPIEPYSNRGSLRQTPVLCNPSLG